MTEEKVMVELISLFKRAHVLLVAFLPFLVSHLVHVDEGSGCDCVYTT